MIFSLFIPFKLQMWSIATRKKTPLKLYERNTQTWMCYDSTQITLCLRDTIHSCSFFPFPPRLHPWRGSGSCMQVISVCSDGRSALIGWLNSYADVKIAGCVCQKTALLMVVTSWRHCRKCQTRLASHTAESLWLELFLLFCRMHPLKFKNQSQTGCKAYFQTTSSLS